MSQTRDLALTHASTALNVLEGLGFVVNYKKSCLEPSQVIEFLGFEINSQTLAILLPRDKIRNIRKQCQILLDNPHLSVRELSKFLGLLTSSIQAIFPAPLHYRNLQFAKNQALQKFHSYETVVHLNQQAVQEIQWWRDHLHAWNGRAILRQPIQAYPTYNRDRCLNQGVGCPLPGSKHRGPVVPSGEGAAHKQSRAPSWVSGSEDICKRCGKGARPSPDGQCLCGKLHQQTRGDPLTCVEQSGSRLMDLVPEQPSQPHCTTHPRRNQYSSRLGVQGLSGLERLETQPTNVCSHQQTVGSLWDRPDCKPPDQTTSQICELETGPRGPGNDAFTVDWNKWKGYAFSPFSMIGRCLRQVQVQQVVELVIVTPVWPAQAWYPLLLELCVDYPVLLPQDPSLLMRGQEIHPLAHLHLAGWLVCIDHSRRCKFLQRLGKSLCQPGVPILPSLIHQPGTSGIAGVWNTPL